MRYTHGRGDSHWPDADRAIFADDQNVRGPVRRSVRKSMQVWPWFDHCATSAWTTEGQELDSSGIFAPRLTLSHGSERQPLLGPLVVPTPNTAHDVPHPHPTIFRTDHERLPVPRPL